MFAVYGRHGDLQAKLSAYDLTHTSKPLIEAIIAELGGHSRRHEANGASGRGEDPAPPRARWAGCGWVVCGGEVSGGGELRTRQTRRGCAKLAVP